MNGFELFLRFAEGCRCYLDDKSLISASDNKKLLECIKKKEEPPRDLLKRVFYVAYPDLEEKGNILGKDPLDPNVVREYYAFRHNRMKFDQGNMICMAFPARVLEKRKKTYLLNLEPVNGLFWVSSDLSLNKGNWVIIHRINIIEKITEEFVNKAIKYLKDIGLSKDYKFPKVAIKYLLRLQKRGGSVYA